jgi:hypothetical protein
MKLPTNDQKVMGKVVRYFRNLEEMAAYLGIDTDELIGKIKNQSMHLSLEKKSTFNNSRYHILKDSEALASCPLFNYTIH